MGTRLSKAYLLTKVLTATKQEVIVYLYEGIISHLHRARTAFGDGRRGAASQSIDRAISIIVELSGSLNYVTGGRLALQLDSIYNYLIESLTLANRHCDQGALQACEGVVTILYDAWQQAAALEQQTDSTPERQLQISA